MDVRNPPYHASSRKYVPSSSSATASMPSQASTIASLFPRNAEILPILSQEEQHHLFRDYLCLHRQINNNNNKNNNNKNTPEKEKKKQQEQQKVWWLLGLLLLLLLLFWVPSSCCSRHRRRRIKVVTSDGWFVLSSGSSWQATKQTVLFDDGTLFWPEATESLCEYYLHPKRRHTPILRVHAHAGRCDNVSHYFWARLVADAARVPITTTCQLNNHNITLWKNNHWSRALIRDEDRPGPVPMDATGRIWTVQDVCRATRDLTFLQLETIRHTMRMIADHANDNDDDDIVIHVGSEWFPHKLYSNLVQTIRNKQHNVRTVMIIHDDDDVLLLVLVRDLARHLQASFPSLVVQHCGGGGGGGSTVRRLVRAKKGVVCGSAACRFPALGVREGVMVLEAAMAPRVSGAWIRQHVPEVLHWLRHQPMTGENRFVIDSFGQLQKHNTLGTSLARL